MPYIPGSERKFKCTSLADEDGTPLTAGQFNYLITQSCIGHLTDRGLNYEALNEIIGALECAKLELYRRVAAPYEQSKMKQNGDVYPFEFTVEHYK